MLQGQRFQLRSGFESVFDESLDTPMRNALAIPAKSGRIRKLQQLPAAKTVRFSLRLRIYLQSALRAWMHVTNPEVRTLLAATS